MVCVPLPAPPNSTPSTLILAAARCWRRTQDSGRPVQAALFRTLDAYRCGMLAPAQLCLVAAHHSDLAAARTCGLMTAYVHRPQEYGGRRAPDVDAAQDWDWSAVSLIELADLLDC